MADKSCETCKPKEQLKNCDNCEDNYGALGCASNGSTTPCKYPEYMRWKSRIQIPKTQQPKLDEETERELLDMYAVNILRDGRTETNYPSINTIKQFLALKISQALAEREEKHKKELGEAKTTAIREYFSNCKFIVGEGDSIFHKLTLNEQDEFNLSIFLDRKEEERNRLFENKLSEALAQQKEDMLKAIDAEIEKPSELWLSYGVKYIKGLEKAKQIIERSGQ